MWTFLHTLSTSILGPEEDCHASEPRPRGKALPFFRGSQRASLESLHGCAYVSNTLTCEAFSTPKRQVYSLSVLRVRSHKGICRTAFLYVYVSVLGGWVGGWVGVSRKSLALSLTAPKVAIFLHPWSWMVLFSASRPYLETSIILTLVSFYKDPWIIFGPSE